MILRLCFLGLAAAFSVFILKNLGFRAAPAVSCLCAVILLSEISVYLSEAVKLYTELAPLTEGAESMLKIVGLSYLFGISADICRELGEGGISSVLLTVGKLEIFAVALPYIRELAEAAIGLLA